MLLSTLNQEAGVSLADLIDLNPQRVVVTMDADNRNGTTLATNLNDAMIQGGKPSIFQCSLLVGVIR